MGKTIKPAPVKLIVGFIFKKNSSFTKAKRLLIIRFGKIDFSSPQIPFNYTDYYQKEFGNNLKRIFVSFKKLIPADFLPKIKNYTNKIEKDFSLKNQRQVNIDPGYLDSAKLILATTKDYNHRIYLNNGIYAEITLFYQNKTYTFWPWTYPDYKTAEYIAIFNKIREIYVKQIKKI